MSLKFRPEDFDSAQISKDSSEAAAMRAQARFDFWLKKQRIVYGNFDGHVFTVSDPKLGLMSGSSTTPDTHTGRLVAIEEIKKEPCKDHQPNVHSGKEYSVNGKVVCRICGVKMVLVQEWKASE